MLAERIEQFPGIKERIFIFRPSIQGQYWVFADGSPVANSKAVGIENIAGDSMMVLDLESEEMYSYDLYFDVPKLHRKCGLHETDRCLYTMGRELKGPYIRSLISYVAQNLAG